MTDFSVEVERIAKYPNVIRMTWSAKPRKDDVNLAFTKINEILTGANTAYYIIVDIRSNPSFPLSETLNGALGPHQHRNLEAWLVLGGNRMARFIGKTLTTIGKHNIMWFDAEEEIDLYLAKHIEDLQ